MDGRARGRGRRRGRGRGRGRERGRGESMGPSSGGEAPRSSPPLVPPVEAMGARGRSCDRGRGETVGPSYRDETPQSSPPSVPPAGTKGPRGRGRGRGNKLGGSSDSATGGRGDLVWGTAIAAVGWGDTMVSWADSPSVPSASKEIVANRGAPGALSRGGPKNRGRGARGRGGPTIPAMRLTTDPMIASSVDAVGVKRPAYGTVGIPVDVMTNCFKVDVPTYTIYHYDVAILPRDMGLSLKAKINIIHGMQDQNPTIFTKRGAYDGRKSLFSPVKYSFGDTAKFKVNDPIKPNRWRVFIQQIDVINPQLAARYIEGKLSLDRAVSTTVSACNVTIQGQPLQHHPLHRRSFLSREGFQDTRRGLELWRCFYQYIRPMIGKLVITVDISSVAVYKSGPLINICLEYLGKGPSADPAEHLSANALNEGTRKDLARYLRNLKVRCGSFDASAVRSIKNISTRGADSWLLNSGDSRISVAAYFHDARGQGLRYPSLFCVQVSSRMWVPLELCDVLPGQVFRRTSAFGLEREIDYFSTMRPSDCLQKIRNGLEVLGYGNSKCLQDFGMSVDPNPMTITGRILPAPTLEYGRKAMINPRDGKWNIRDTSLYKPARIWGCAIIIYDRKFTCDQEQHLKTSLVYVAQRLGIQGMPHDPPVIQKNPTGTGCLDHLQEAGMMHKSLKGNMPNLIIIVLPDVGGKDTYLAIKSAADIEIGVATQCLRASKCGKGNGHYFSDVWSQINAKLGGVNFVPKFTPLLNDVANPIIVMGADIKPGRLGQSIKPSYTAVVGSVDSEHSKYIAISRAQGWSNEKIEDLADMVSHLIRMYMQYRKEVEKKVDLAPQRILFYRNSWSEGQLEALKDFEVAQIFKACDRLAIARPKLTFVVVGKRHRIRDQADRSGNVPAGFVADREITSPAEYDFYLKSHESCLGTSRPAHYNVLLDQNNFMPDDLQRLSYTLCYMNMRSTYSTSVVSPVQYASTVCRRAPTQYNPDGDFKTVPDTKAQELVAGDTGRVKALCDALRPVHPNAARNMYFL